MCLLLSAAETAEMMDDFDRYDINKGRKNGQSKWTK